MTMQKKMIVLIGCAWVLWQTVAGNSIKPITNPIIAYETRGECVKKVTEQRQTWTETKGHRKTQDGLLYDTEGFLFSYVCLPDTVKPE
jgi:hypothetical protein